MISQSQMRLSWKKISNREKTRTFNTFSFRRPPYDRQRKRRGSGRVTEIKFERQEGDPRRAMCKLCPDFICSHHTHDGGNGSINQKEREEEDLLGPSSKSNYLHHPRHHHQSVSLYQDDDCRQLSFYPDLVLKVHDQDPLL